MAERFSSLSASDLEALEALIQSMALHVNGLLAVFQTPREEQRRPRLVVASEALDSRIRVSLTRQVFRLRRNMHLSDAEVPLTDVASAFAQGVVFPLMSDMILVGVVVVLSRDANLSDHQRWSVRTGATLMRGMLENAYLRESLRGSLTAAQSILALAQSIADTPSPQAMVEMLRDALFSPAISGCAVLYYGPREENLSHRQSDYSYLEMAGAWTRRRGSGGGIGLRVYLHGYRTRLHLLAEERSLVVQRVDETSLSVFDPLIRAFLRDETIRSVAFFGLQSGQQPLGIMVVMADQVNYFTPGEMNTYHLAAELVSVTALARMLAEQRDRVRQLRSALADAVSDAILLVVPYTGESRVVSINPVFSDWFDVPTTAAPGLTLEDVLMQMCLPEDVRLDLRDRWAQLPTRSGDMQEGEFHFVHRSGQTRAVAWTSAPVVQDGQVLGRVYAFHDVTADREALRLRAEYLTRISHELRTPLTSIQGFAQFILEATGDDLPPIAREYTEIILNNAKQLKAIISDIIDVTRADAGQVHLNREMTSMVVVAREALASFQLMASQRNQTLHANFAEPLPNVDIDRQRIIQVLNNLILNGIKFAPDGGTITVRLGTAENEQELPESAPPDVVLPCVVVTVDDSGFGIEDVDAERIFMPFFRTQDARRKRIDGVGLGMTIARSMIEIHQGKIWAVPRSIAGCGRIVFTLPVARAVTPHG